MNKNRNYGWYALAVATAVVGALWLGVPAETLVTLGLVLVCPLMMLLMMRGMHGGDHGHRRESDGRSGPHDHTTAG